MTDILALVQGGLAHPLVKFVFVLLVTNFITGTLVALKPGVPVEDPQGWKLGAVADWMVRALFYVLAALCVQILAYYATAGYEAMFNVASTATWAFVLLSLAGKVIQNLRDLGIPLPDALGDRRKPPAQIAP